MALEQFAQRLAFVEHAIRSVLIIERFQVVIVHRVIDRLGDAGRCDRACGWVLAVAVAGSVSLTASDAAARQHIGEAVRPIIAAGFCHAARTRVPSICCRSP